MTGARISFATRRRSAIRGHVMAGSLVASHGSKRKNAASKTRRMNTISHMKCLTLKSTCGRRLRRSPARRIIHGGIGKKVSLAQKSSGGLRLHRTLPAAPGGAACLVTPSVSTGPALLKTTCQKNPFWNAIKGREKLIGFPFHRDQMVKNTMGETSTGRNIPLSLPKNPSLFLFSHLRTFCVNG